MKYPFHIWMWVCGLFLMALPLSAAPESNPDSQAEELNVKEMILEHLADTYEWKITGWDNGHITVPLPVILHSKTSGWHLFLSSKLHNDENSFNGFYVTHEGKYKGKIVERDASGAEIRPFDLSLTKNAASLIFSSILLIILVMSVARSMRRNPMEGKKGFIGLMEMFIMSIHDDVIKPAVGKDHARYAPFLLTVFFFIFLNNLLGLVPVFPGGANVTGNIAVTMVLAISTLLVVNLTGTKEYYKEIFWPDVPKWLKVPVPLMPVIELVGVFTKPFALMIRLFANITGGHSTVMGLTAIVFVTASMGATINASMTALSVIFTVFIMLVELLVAFIQAYVFTMLSAVFIGMARVESHQKEKELVETKYKTINK